MTKFRQNDEGTQALPSEDVRAFIEIFTDEKESKAELY